MAPLQKAILTIESEIGGGTITGEFHMEGDIEITAGIRTGYLLGGTGSQVVGFLSGEASEFRFGFGGPQFWEINFRGWEGSDLKWGDSGSGGTPTDATGEDPLSQMDVLMEYMAKSNMDSGQPATLEYGEYSDQGRFSPQTVSPEQPQMTRAAEDGSWVDGSMTLLATKEGEDIVDALFQLPF